MTDAVMGAGRALLLATTAIASAIGPVQAQIFVGNEETSGPFSSGTQEFFDDSRLNASVANAVRGGRQYFYTASALNASAANAVSGGTQYFSEASALNASVADAVSGGTQRFNDSSALNALAENAVSDSSRQDFYGDSALNASVANAVSGGTQWFYDSSTLNASAGNAVSGGVQEFYDSSAFNASVANAVSSGRQNFSGTSTLNASAANAVNGGVQGFEDTSTLNISAANAVSGGAQWFFNTSTLNASAGNAVSGGVQEFYDSSAFNASVANAVSGGTQYFQGTSTLNASTVNAVSGGTQEFYEFSRLNASHADAISGGTQRFYYSSTLNASVANAVSGGRQNFSGTSALTASAANAVNGGVQGFEDTSTLNISATNAVSGGTQRFYHTSILNAAHTDAVGGGGQYFFDTSTLNASAANAVNGGTQEFYENSTLNASAGNAVSGGNQIFRDTSRLNASAINAVSGGTQILLHNSILNVLAANALTTAADIQFDNSFGGSGGTLRLNGYSTTVGRISSVVSGSGVITNGGSGDSLLTVDTSAAPSTFSGVIQDGGAGALALSLMDGTLTLSGANTYTGSTTVNGGTLLAGSANGFVANAAYAVNGGTLDLRGFDLAMSSLSGAGGTVALGTANLTVDQVATTTYAGAITGSGGIVKLGTGVTTLTGDSSAFTGTTLIGDGTLAVANALGGSASVTGGSFVADGTFGGAVEARTGGIVSGMGTIAGDTDVTGGGVMAGARGQLLSIGGDLTMDASSVVNVALGGPSATALFHVGGDLTLDGTLNVADAGGFGAGIYRIFGYDNALTDQGLAIGSTPAGVGAGDLFVQTAVANQVNLISTADALLGFWDGGDTALHDNGMIDGGAGTWRADGRTWTQGDGVINGPFQPNPTYAVFQGAARLVSVDASAGAIGVTGMQFAADGYRIEGDAITLEGAGGESIIRVGDGFASGANMTATIASELLGNSALVKSDHGTLVLEGTNSYMGGTILRVGALSVSSDANLGAVAGGLTFDGGTLATTASFASARAITLDAVGRFDVASGTILGLSGPVGSSGDLVKQGDGTLILSGANAYGDTLVEAGTLIGDAGSISGNLGNAATFVFDQGAYASFAGTIAGFGGTDGQMVKRGAGKLVLSGTSSLDWTIEAGGLIADASRFGGNAEIAASTSLTFDQTTAAVYAGVLSGAGGFIVTGTGTTTLIGDSSVFTGITLVSGGELIVGTAAGGALGGSVTIGDGGLLGGIGTIGSAGSAVTIAPGGVHAPGNSIGVQHVAGDYVNHGMLRIEATPTEADRIEVAGSVDITGATLDLVLSPTDAASWNVFNGPYTIIDKKSGGYVIGTFIDPATQNLLFLDALVAYDGGDGNDVTLELQRNDLAFAGVGHTPNQIATGTAVDTLDRTHAVWRSIALTNDQDLVRASFDVLSGEIHASALTGLIEDSRFVRNAINDRIRAAFATPGASYAPVLAYGPGDAPVLVSSDHAGPVFWAHGFGSWGSTDSDANAASLERSTGGLLIGADMPVGDWRIGLLAGYSRSSIDAGDRSSTASIDNYHLGLYGGTQWGDFAFRTGAAYTWHDLDTARTVAIPGIAESLTAGYRAGTFQAFGELAYGFDMGATRFEPFANLAHVHVHVGGFAEAGRSAALSGNEGDTDVTFTTLGLRAEHGVTLGGIDATFRSMLGWRHASGDSAPTSIHAFTAGSAFTIAGTPIARNAAVVEAGLDFNLTPEATFSLSYAGQAAAEAQDHGFKANLSIRF